jgi:intracellular septation protein
MKFLIDFLPLLAFFVAYLRFDIYVATVALTASLALALFVYRIWKGEWHKVHLVTYFITAALGAFTLYAHDPRFIKFKPTAVYAVFALALLGSHVVGPRVLLARLGHNSFPLPEPLWRKINFAWAMFFAFCAALNLYVASHFSEAAWVKFKIFGFTLLPILFTVAHFPFVARHLPPPSTEQAS